MELHAALSQLPTTMFNKNSRRQRDVENPGQCYFGMSTFAGPQTQAVLGKQTPYSLKGNNQLKENHNKTYKQLVDLAEMMWIKGSQLFKEETEKMNEVDDQVTIGKSKWTCAAIARNLAAKGHLDLNNMIKGIQAVCVFGNFEGGEVLFGKDHGIIAVPNKHGTIFYGTYRQLFHRVLKVLKGTRIIVAFWTTEAIYQYSKQVLAYFPWKQCDPTKIAIKYCRIVLVFDIAYLLFGLRR